MFGNINMTKRGRGRGNWNSRQSVQASSTVQHAPLEPPPMPAGNLMSATDNYYEVDNQDANGVQGYDTDADMKEEVQDDDQTIPFEGDDCEDEGDEEGGKKKGFKRFWRGPRGTRLKRKKVPGAKNLKIKKYAQPKNAVMCLNELVPGIIYSTEQDGGMSKPYCMYVEINEQKYRGFGSTKQLAKQAAAEAALISYVKPPVTAGDSQEDKTPWATLVSFAMYKLFNDWREGRVGMCPPSSQAYGTAIPNGAMLAGINAYLTQPAGDGIKENSLEASTLVEAISAHLGGRSSSTVTSTPDPKTNPKALPKPAKQVPEGASTMHPVMVLNQMKPGVQYNVNETNRDGKAYFIITTELDGKDFSGEGENVKKAKFSLAKAAIQGLYGVESTFTG